MKTAYDNVISCSFFSSSIFKSFHGLETFQEISFAFLDASLKSIINNLFHTHTHSHTLTKTYGKVSEFIEN